MSAKTALEIAVEVVNTHRRRPIDPPLLLVAICEMPDCGEQFAMMPQDFSRADVHGHPKICRFCTAEYKRNKRKK